MKVGRDSIIQYIAILYVKDVNCLKLKNRDDFNKIPCQEHKLCVECRIDGLKRDNKQCPIMTCKRKYSQKEKNSLKDLSNNLRKEEEKNKRP